MFSYSFFGNFNYHSTLHPDTIYLNKAPSILFLMRFYVLCYYHPGEHIYINFGRELQTRSEVPFQIGLTCPSGIYGSYNNRQVIAEVGTEPLAGAIIGGLLFLIDPLLGLLGALGGAASVNAKEQEKVNRFNNS